MKVFNTNVTIELNLDYSKPQNNDTSIPTMRNIVINNITGDNAAHLYQIKGLPQRDIQNVYFANINITNVSEGIVQTCRNITGTCDASSVFPSCPPCLVTEGCSDAVDVDCSTYVNYCNLPAYRTS